eukprot:TRINITY_DN29658_c0_g1_i1.p1 TRINITY_DN29658_c0_g1~~TRINITY_DN29658_c0_g1_i1.p1  ORF type:complete len:272 (+),score=76.77 TRINITY_DN29658_c0_g1_i1:26-817(+)
MGCRSSTQYCDAYCESSVENDHADAEQGDRTSPSAAAATTAEKEESVVAVTSSPANLVSRVSLKKKSQEGREKTPLEKVHSVIRWGKSSAEVQHAIAENCFTLQEMLKQPDLQNGNLALHIAAQNGHLALTKFLVASGADVNAQNGKGQTALHMSIEYDFYFQSKWLMSHAGADKSKLNNDGHPAILGIDGGKTGSDAWDVPMNILNAAGDDRDELEEAFAALEAAEVSTLDRAVLARAGLQKKKTCTEHWDNDRFMAIMKKL